MNKGIVQGVHMTSRLFIYSVNLASIPASVLYSVRFALVNAGQMPHLTIPSDDGPKRP